jgi:tRNA-splicing ligase RtcB
MEYEKIESDLLYIKSKDGLVIKSWCRNPEEGAIQQALNIAHLPFAFHHIALAPDSHQGFGMPIGGILATKNIIVVSAVGVDIGCGMIATQTSIKVDEFEDFNRNKILNNIRKAIPVGFHHHEKPQAYWPDIWPNGLNEGVVSLEAESAMHQLGTLGSGNHFLEIQKGSDGHIWIMIHSGSRNLGKKVADYYNSEARELNARYFSMVPKEWDLAFLPLDSDEGQEYIEEMNNCLIFAKANRKHMMDKSKEIFKEFVDVDFIQDIDIHHNYATMENHFGSNVMVHRKGATSAKEGQLGIIPGSQGTASYIVRGKGNPESFKSCSHGAGRKMGRKEACRTLDFQAELNNLESKGIFHSLNSKEDLEEAPGAYKDIDIVMEEQKDLVEIVTRLEPLGVIKG